MDDDWALCILLRTPKDRRSSVLGHDNPVILRLGLGLYVRFRVRHKYSIPVFMHWSYFSTFDSRTERVSRQDSAELYSQFLTDLFERGQCLTCRSHKVDDLCLYL